jgi:hypothetical protein
MDIFAWRWSHPAKSLEVLNQERSFKRYGAFFLELALDLRRKNVFAAYSG